VHGSRCSAPVQPFKTLACISRPRGDFPSGPGCFISVRRRHWPAKSRSWLTSAVASPEASRPLRAGSGRETFAEADGLLRGAFRERSTSSVDANQTVGISDSASVANEKWTLATFNGNTSWCLPDDHPPGAPRLYAGSATILRAADPRGSGIRRTVGLCIERGSLGRNHRFPPRFRDFQVSPLSASWVPYRARCREERGDPMAMARGRRGLTTPADANI